MKIFAMLALIPFAIGPLPKEQQSITAALCNGGTMIIPLGDKERQPRGECLQKGCHAGSCREKTRRAKR